jgi:hypothetical protein
VQNTTPSVLSGEWRKASFSGAGNDCVELAVRPTVTGIRDTKSRTAGTLVLPDGARAALIGFAASTRVTA